MSTDTNPRHRNYHSMTEEQKAAHIKRHSDVADSCVDIFEMTSGYRLQLIADSVWAEAIFYTARIRCIKYRFAVDRYLSVAGQIAAIERGLQATRNAYEHWELEMELKKILDLHGVADARKV